MAEQEVLHDENNGKFYIPFSDKQAVLRYSLDDETEEIYFQSIFIPPSLRENGLAENIAKAAYEFATGHPFSPLPKTLEDFLKENQEHI